MQQFRNALRSATGTGATFSRQGALAAASRARQAQEATTGIVAPAIPVGWMMVGSLLIGAGVSLFIRADLGLPPYDVLLSAIKGPMGVSHGQAGWIVAVLLLAIATLLGHRPKTSTLLYILANGIAIDSILPLVQTPSGIVARMLFVAFGVVIIAAGLSVTVAAGGTGGAFELIIRGMADRKVSPLVTRMSLEFGVLIAGVLMAGSFGLVTVVFALSIGPAVAVTTRALDDFQTGRELRASLDADLAEQYVACR